MTPNLGMLAAGFLICLAAEAAGGSESEPERYPWDRRPASCFVEPAAATQECAPQDWPNFEVTVDRVIFLYESRQFALLERALAELCRSEQRFINGRPVAAAAYTAFRSMMSGDSFDPRDGERIAVWRSAVPGSVFADFAEARWKYAAAWNARGAGYAGSVSEEAWELFGKYLGEADAILLAAKQGLMDTPLWYQLQLAIALDTTRVRADRDEVFREAVKRWPVYYDFYTARMSRLTPRWGGSWEEIEAFIDYWSQQQQALEGKSFYARLYIDLIGSQGLTLNEPMIDWARMIESLSDLVSRRPDPVLFNVRASLACYARDKAAFEDAMNDIPPGALQPEYWAAGSGIEACKLWAAK